MSSINQDKVRISSLLPLALENDSRTLKIAKSFARAGYISEVHEHIASTKTFPPLENFSVHPLWPRTFEWVRNITKRGWKVDNADKIPSHSRPSIANDSIKNIIDAIHFLLFIAAYFCIRPLCAALKPPRTNIIYLHEYRLFPVAWIWQKLTGAKLIYDAHDFYPLVRSMDSLSLFWRSIFLPFLEYIERSVCRTADAVITTSDGIAGLILDKYGVTATVIRNCHDSFSDRKSAELLRQTLSIAPDQPILAVVGHRKPAQSLNILIDNIIRLNQNGKAIHLVFIGRGYEPLVDDTPDAAGKCIHTLGAVPPWEIVPLLTECNAVALPYFPENAHYQFALPNGFFQAVAARLPLLYPPLLEIERLLDGTNSGIAYDPRQNESVKTALSRLLQDVSKNHTDHSGLERISSQLNWQNEELKLLELIRSVKREE
ncbi:glycosyltransferase [Rhodospirillales bacterium]|nr:glycosyltransferase [Rhodospirillales bacterium]